MLPKVIRLVYKVDAVKAGNGACTCKALLHFFLVAKLVHQITNTKNRIPRKKERKKGKRWDIYKYFN